MIQVGMLINSRYEIEEKIGTGGMSTVYKATDIKLGRHVAVKVLKDEFCYDDAFVGKFKVEAQAAASLSHSNIVNIYDVGNDGKIYYIVMEYLSGMTLKSYIKAHGTLDNEETMRIGASMASALECAHSNHIIHRDIKPQNIMVTKEGRVKVADFGIARVATGATIPVSDMASGSVHYIPPEQAKGGYTNEQSDIYSLGITMFEMMTGQVPFEGDSAVSVALKQIHDDLPSIEALCEGVDGNLAQIVRKATMKKPEHRYQTASEMLEDLKAASNFPEERFVATNRFDSNAATTMMDEGQMHQIWSESEVMEDRNPKVEKAVVAGGILSAVAAVSLLVIFLFGQFKDNLIPVEVAIPNVQGMDVHEATSALTAIGLILRPVESYYNSDVERNAIIAQDPKEGLMVGEGTEVAVVVSLGRQLFKVPTVTNANFTVAEKMLRDAGMVPVRNEVTDDFASVGTVVGQYPEAGQEVVKGTEVTITISLGKAIKYVEVPDVRGMTLEEAQDKLRIAGLVPGSNTTESYNDVVEKGRVIAMTARPKDSVAEGYVVDVTISLGKEIVDVTKTIVVTNILGPDEETALLKVVLIQKGSETELFNKIVSHSDFDAPIQIPATGLGTGVYEVYKDGGLEYTDSIVFSEETPE